MGDLLGRGGMAEVFAGSSVGDHGFQKPVAIKRLLPELANDEVFVDRLIEEAKILVGMQHGNIVSVLDLAREGDDVFLVMEFVDGPSLRQLIKARGSRGLSFGTATYIVQSAAAGLEFAHARPGGAIIHADISPSNLLLTTSGEVRVADFGIARREGGGEGVVEGKWAYMAPEQARGEALTPRSDVFALGVVLYELLTGQHPFGRAVTANQRDDQMRVIPPRVVKPSVPPGLDAICMRALAHDPRDRYARMQQLIDALVEERFANQYREGASDLAQAIREVAPKADVAGSPRTMHTDRPVTIMTRSLLREVTPARRDVTPAHRELTPSHRASYPSQPLGPNDPPPRDAFPDRRTIGMEAMALPPSDAFQLPSSGEHTVARVIDQVALAQAAEAAAAMLEIPSVLRADGTPMPPFRMSDALLHDGLANVVGGHNTVTGHGAVAVAVEHRGHRWTFGVLAAAAMIGVAAAVVIQLRTSSAADASPAPALAAQIAAPVQPAVAAAPPPPAPTIQPTIQEPAASAALEAAQAPAQDPQAATAPGPNAQAATAPAPNTQAATAPTTQAATAPAPNTQAATAPGPNAQAATAPAGTPPDSKAVEPPTPGAGPTAQVPTSPEAPAAAATPEATEPAPAAPDARPGRTKRTGRGDKRGKGEQGILSVQAAPWAWVTVGNQRKETPDKFYLPPGNYVVKFYNPELGITKFENVTIVAGKLERLDESMDR
jgi:serine/threonine protein kinase